MFIINWFKSKWMDWFKSKWMDWKIHRAYKKKIKKLKKQDPFIYR